jgi:hypothetical protein
MRLASSGVRSSRLGLSCVSDIGARARGPDKGTGPWMGRAVEGCRNGNPSEGRSVAPVGEVGAAGHAQQDCSKIEMWNDCAGLCSLLWRDFAVGGRPGDEYRCKSESRYRGEKKPSTSRIG